MNNNNTKKIVYCRVLDCVHNHYEDEDSSGVCIGETVDIDFDKICLCYKKKEIPKPKPNRSKKRYKTELVKNFKPKDIIGEWGTYYEGFRGTMVTNKLTYEYGMFALIDPIVQKNVSIYAAFNGDDDLVTFVTDAHIGWHLPDTRSDTRDRNGADIEFNEICTGELKFSRNTKVEDARAMCIAIAKQLEVINCDSAGDELSGDYCELDNIITELADGNEPSEIDGFDDYLRPLLLL
jgi:hypothetical protein